MSEIIAIVNQKGSTGKSACTANRVLISVQSEYLTAKGLEQLLSTVGKVRRQINPSLKMDSVLLAMVDNRTNFAKEISALLRSHIEDWYAHVSTCLPVSPIAEVPGAGLNKRLPLYGSSSKQGQFLMFSQNQQAVSQVLPHPAPHFRILF